MKMGDSPRRDVSGKIGPLTIELLCTNTSNEAKTGKFHLRQVARAISRTIVERDLGAICRRFV
jgi:hypothetical protein